MKFYLSAALTLIGVSAPALAAAPAKPLFASDEVVRLTLRADVDRLWKDEPGTSNRIAGTIGQSGTAEALPIQLNLRGITRREKDVCQAPPLAVTLGPGVPATSLFAGQRRLKLVTHCRQSEGFQQNVLLEYAAYRMYNQLTPRSFRARLAKIDYVRGDGRPIVSRYGFFIEDADDVAARNGMREAKMGERVPSSRLASADAARFALYEYMIANLDWSMTAGPAGENCCHNSRLIGEGGSASRQFVPVPYDFDFSGLVDAPYAMPPPGIPVRSVKQRRFRGYCRDLGEAKALLPAFRAQRAMIEPLLASIPDLRPETRAKAVRFLGGFFADIATDASANQQLFATCLK